MAVAEGVWPPCATGAALGEAVSPLSLVGAEGAEGLRMAAVDDVVAAEEGGFLLLSFFSLAISG